MGGFFGVTSTQDCVAELFYGTDYHSHLGTRRAGMAVRNDDGFTRFIHDISNTQFRAKFEGHLPELHGTQGIGIISDYEDQPLLIGSRHGIYGIATVGRVLNIEELTTRAFRDHSGHLSEISGTEFNPTELVATLINEGQTFEEGIRHAQEVIEGSCSLLLLTKKGLYVARDRLGRTPVVIGKKPGAYAVTSESCALPNLGFTTERYLGPGEIVRLSPEGVEQLAPPGDRLQICTFLWVYYGFPASSYEDINVEAARNRCGMVLARADDTEVDFVAGIPDSGIGHAIGYAAERNLPYRRPFVKYTPTWPRSFMPQEQRVRDLVARMKLIPIRELIEGNRLLFCEDSIVRGTQLRDIIRRLFDYGAKEIHMRPACPPLVHSCKFLNFSRSKSELDLAARKAIMTLERIPDDHLEDYADPTTDRHARMMDHIREQLGLTSLKYQKLEDMVEAIGLAPEKLCTYCWNGQECH